MRGLSRPDHVRLMQGYCPLCFKGCPGLSGTAWFRKKDERIDEELLEMPNGLPLLDLSAPGEPCKHHQMCKMTCLVCGKSMMDGDDPEFHALVDLVEDLRSKIEEHREQVMTEPMLAMLSEAMRKDLKKERDRALRKYSLTWLDRWDRPVHKKCAKETPCQCVVPVCSDICRTHNRRIPTRQKRVLNISSRACDTPKITNIMETKLPQTPQVTIIPAQKPRTSVTLTKATWMKKPSEMAGTSSVYTASPSQTSQPPCKKRKPPPIKPNLRLQAAAATCQKMENFARDKPGKDSGKTKAVGGPNPEDDEPEYDLDWHNANFDSWQHGDFWRGGQMWFRRPDGKVIPSFEGVRKFTKTGYLVPG